MCCGLEFGAVPAVRAGAATFAWHVCAAEDGTASMVPIRSFVKRGPPSSNLSPPLAKVMTISASANKPV